MNQLTLFALLIVSSFAIYYKVELNKAKISYSNDVKTLSDENIRLRHEKYVRDNKIMNVDVLIQNEKTIKRVKNYYFQN